MSEFTDARLCQLSYRVIRELPDSRTNQPKLKNDTSASGTAVRWGEGYPGAFGN